MSKQTKTRGLIRFLSNDRALFIRRDDLDGNWEVGFQDAQGREETASAGDDVVDVNNTCDRLFTQKILK